MGGALAVANRGASLGEALIPMDNSELRPDDILHHFRKR
jgi:hypothetical protein